MGRLTAEEMQKTWSRMPTVRRALDALGRALYEEGTLDAPLQDMVRLRSAHIQGCQR